MIAQTADMKHIFPE